MPDHARPTVAFVLAAGLGTRMRPMTDMLPKPLVSLAGRPLIDHVLDRLAAAGITRAVVNVHHHADKLEAHLKSRREPWVTFSDERGMLLDTGGGVVKALPLIGNGPFVIHNSDSVWIEGRTHTLSHLLDTWDADKMDSLMLLAPTATTLGYHGQGDFLLASDGRLKRRADKGDAPFVFAGVSIAHPRMFEGALAGPFSLNRVWDAAIGAGRLYGLPMEGLWMHVGDPVALRLAEERLARATLGTPRPGTGS